MTDLDRALAETMRSEESVSSERALLLWFLRNVLLVEELDAYEHVLEQQRDAFGFRWDAAFLAGEDGAEGGQVLNLVEVKGESTDPPVDELVDRVRANGMEEALVLLSSRRKSKGRDISVVATQLHLVCPKIDGSSHQTIGDGIEVWVHGGLQLERIAHALAAPVAVSCELKIPVEVDGLLVAEAGGTPVAVCPVKAIDIVEWPGLAERTLFDLNVRVELGASRVRRSLDRAIEDSDSHPDFLAFHNGLTVVCNKFEKVGSQLVVTDISVVNGAQSVLAFERNRQHLTERLEVLVKFVAVDTTSDLAREVAIRSNTQNPVDSRNLRALDSRQLDLAGQFDAYPRYAYATRPGSPHPPTGVVEIKNDDAAQLLCAVYNEQPWLAVKRLTLFEPKHYRMIFAPRIEAAHIIFCHEIYAKVQLSKDSFPEQYRRAWRLTAIVATYLAGQVFRSTDELRPMLDEPTDVLGSTDLDAAITESVSIAAEVLGDHLKRLVEKNIPDDFKVDFKRESALRSLAQDARRLGARRTRS